MTNLKQALKDKLTEKEFEYLKTSFDIIGDVAILEIDDELKKKEKLIAKTLLDIQKNVKVVCKKSGIHKGVFRTQDLKILAGEKRKETICKENSVQIKLNAEKVYFSPRLSTERKRIGNMLGKNEEILAMFSGAGPYPLVMARKEPTSKIVSVEINPSGVKSQKENLVLNKSIAKKVVQSFFKDDKKALIHAMHRIIDIRKGDVSNVIPMIENGKYFLPVELKEAKELLSHEIKYIELILKSGDLEDNYEKIVSVLNKAKKKYVDVMIRLPEVYQSKNCSLYSKDKDGLSECYTLLSKVDELYKRNYNIIGFVIEPKSFNYENDYTVLKSNLEKISYSYKDLVKILYLRNNVMDFFKESELKDFVKSGYNLCFDINSFFGMYKDNIKLIDIVKYFSEKKSPVYYALSDSNGDAIDKNMRLKIGTGDILFDRIIPMIGFGCIDVYENGKGINGDKKKNQSSGLFKKRFESYKHAVNLRGFKKFDRILMPLPKSAESFLPIALKCVKKGTVVHFYDFLHVDNFYQAREKIERSCKEAGFNFEILDLVKCGQHAPRVFRICVDFKIK